MKKIFYILASAIVALGAVACNNELDENINANTSVDGIALRATIDEATRVTIADRVDGKHAISLDQTDVLVGYGVKAGVAGATSYEFTYNAENQLFECINREIRKDLLEGGYDSIVFTVGEFDSSKGKAGIEFKAAVEPSKLAGTEPAEVALKMQSAVLMFESAYDVTFGSEPSIFSDGAATYSYTAAEGVQYIAVAPTTESVNFTYNIVGSVERNATFNGIVANTIYNLGTLSMVEATITTGEGTVVKFNTLAEAVASAKNGETVVLVNDLVLEAPLAIAAENNLTLDLNGKTISGTSTESATYALIDNKGNLTIQNGTIAFHTDAYSASNGYASNTISNNGVLVIKDGALIENTSEGGACYAIDNYGGSTCTIEGGEVKALKTAVRIYQYSATQPATTLNVTGGTITAEKGYGINTNTAVPNYTINITGGTVNASYPGYDLGIYLKSSDDKGTDNFKVNISGGTFTGGLGINGKTCSFITAENFAISGGNFGGCGVECWGDVAEGFITGGTFAKDPSAYVVYSKKASFDEGTNIYSIVDKAPIATIEGKEEFIFETVEELFKAIEAGDKATINAGEYGQFPVADLQGKEGVVINAEGAVFDAGNSATHLNLKGVTIKGATFTAENIRGDVGTITGAINGTYENCTFTGDWGALRYCYTEEGETLVFTNCVFEGETYGVHFDGGKGKIIFNNCEFYGFNALGGAIELVTFNGGLFGHKEGGSSYNGINLYGNTIMNDVNFKWGAQGVTEWCHPRGATKSYSFDGVTVNGATLTYKDINVPCALTIDGEIYMPWANEIVLDGNKVTVVNVEATTGTTIKGNGIVVLEPATINTAEGNAITLAEDANVTLVLNGEQNITAAKNAIYVPAGATLNIEGDANTKATIEAKAGSAIGGAAANISINGVGSLSATANGTQAFGIGGNGATVKIENTTIDYVAGGMVQALFVNDTKYGKSEPEGGAAIGGADIDIIGSTITKAEGGSKAAAIGAQYWQSTNINIENSTLGDIFGGNASAAIGGSRYGSDSKYNVEITIKGSTVKNAVGGQAGAGIGSGYDVHCDGQNYNAVNNIVIENSNITAKGGYSAAAIGTGYHAAYLTGSITNSTINGATQGETYYKDGYTTTQTIGYGIVDPAREFSGNNAKINFTVDGELISAPAIVVSKEKGVSKLADNSEYFLDKVAALQWFAEQVNTNGNTFKGATVKLTADEYDLAGISQWIPVGNVGATQFAGTFDGQGATIKNLKSINSVNTIANYATGFFGWVGPNATIQNLNIVGADIAGLHYVAAVAGKLQENASVKNCRVEDATIEAVAYLWDTADQQNGDKVGAIVGYADLHCAIEGNTAKNITMTGYRDMGGIVGYAYGSVKSNKVEGITFNVDNEHNYKEYTMRSQYDINAIVGEAGKGATVANNTANGVVTNWGDVKAVRVYVYAMENSWAERWIYTWDANDTKYTGDWAGSQMTAKETINGKEYLYYELPIEAEGKELNIIINNGGKGEQSGDFKLGKINGDKYLLLYGSALYTITDKNNPEADKPAMPTILYLKPNANWKKDNARFAAYFFGAGEKWVSMTDSDKDGIYEVEAPAGYPNVIFCRMSPSATANNWNNKWNQTADLKAPTDGKTLYTVKEGTWDNGGGTWSAK